MNKPTYGRTLCLTEKVKTSFGNTYTHVDYIDGEVVSVNISVSGNKEETTVDELVKALSESLRMSVRKVRGNERV